MARPKKNNADYISHDVGMRNHRKVKAIRVKFGIEWYAVWCMVLEYLGSCDFFEAVIDDVEWEILSWDFEVSCDRLQQIVGYMIQIGMLQKEWDVYKSQSLIERLQPMLEKRDRERNRIPATETDSLSQDEAESTQSKGKETKEKKSRKESKEPQGEHTLSTGSKKLSEQDKEEIVKILQVVKEVNDGVLSGNSKDNFIYALNIQKALSKHKQVVNKNYTESEILQQVLVLVRQNEYHRHKVGSVLKVQQNLWELLQIANGEFAKAQSQETPTFDVL